MEDVDIKTKICSKCKEEKIIDDFTSRGKSKTTGLSLKSCVCKKCKNRIREVARKANMTEARKEANKRRKKRFNEKNPDASRRSWLRVNYGIDQEDYNNLLISQNNSCAICGKDKNPNGRALSVDHCHTTGIIRGILCADCNSGIGYFKDSIQALEKAIEYLRNTKK